MNSRLFTFAPTSGLTKETVCNGTLVRCLGGASLGMRIHFEAPSLASGSEAGEPLVDGEAYLAPQGQFHRFWITCPTQVVASYYEDVRLQVLDCVTPVMVMNNLRGKGVRYRYVAGRTETIWDAGTGVFTLFDEGAAGTTSDALNPKKSLYTERGWIGGGVSAAAGSYRIIAYEYLDGSGVNKAEIARWDVNQADLAGKFSCSFSFGARNSFNSVGTVTKNGALFVPWPPLGLYLEARTNGGDVTTPTWCLYQRESAV